MASVYHRLAFAALRTSCRPVTRRKAYPLAIRYRQYHPNPQLSARRPRDEDEDSGASDPPPDAQRVPFEFRLEDLSAEERKEFEALTPAEQKAVREETMAEVEAMESPDFDRLANADVTDAAKLFDDSVDDMALPLKLRSDALDLTSSDEEEPENFGTDDEFEGDDITSIAHGQLEQHREMREYARIAVWEMPLLHKLSKPFEPPSSSTPLRFRMTTYLGESHPAAKKVTVDFRTRDIAAIADLTEAQRIKLIKLVGVRYNPDTDVVKMSSEAHDTPTQNKRYLADLVQTLIKEAKDGRDTFEDVPLDFRHHRPKKKWYFPEDWKLNDRQKKQQLIAERAQAAQLEDNRWEEGKVVEGRQVLDAALLRISSQTQRLVTNQRR